MSCLHSANMPKIVYKCQQIAGILDSWVSASLVRIPSLPYFDVPEAGEGLPGGLGPGVLPGAQGL